MRLNLSTNGGALADPEYVRMVAPQFEPRKKVANFRVRLRGSRSQLRRFALQLIHSHSGATGVFLLIGRGVYFRFGAKKKMTDRCVK